jgi:hypothetical protein
MCSLKVCVVFFVAVSYLMVAVSSAPLSAVCVLSPIAASNVTGIVRFQEAVSNLIPLKIFTGFNKMLTVRF